MNDDDIRSSIRQGYDWQKDEAMAVCNAILWLTQAANNETPHGGSQPCHVANNAATPLKMERSSYEPTDLPNSPTKIAGGTVEDQSGTAIFSPITQNKETTMHDEIRFDGVDMLPLADGNE